MRRRLRLFAATLCLASWAAFTILWWRSIGREDCVSICVPLVRIESPRPGADLLPSATPLVNPEMSVDPPDPRVAKRRCLLLSVNSMAGKFGVHGAVGIIPADGAEFDWHLASVSPPEMDPWFAYKKSKKSLLGFAYIPHGTRDFGLAAPFCFLVSASGIASALLWD